MKQLKQFRGIWLCLLLLVLIAIPAVAKLELVATVNINDEEIKADQDTAILNFEIENKLGIQSNIRYGLEITDSQTNEIKYIKIQKDSIILAPGETIKVEDRVEIPEFISGRYNLNIIVKNDAGTILAKKTFARRSSNTLLKNLGVFITNCKLYTQGKEYYLYEGIPANKSISLECDIKTEEDIKVTPVIETYAKSEFGEKLNSQKTNIIELKGDKLIIPIEVQETPGVYLFKLYLLNEGKAIEGFFGKYIVEGSYATVNNIVFDKENYTEGDVAKIKLFWKFSDFVNTPKISIRILNEDEKICGEIEFKALIKQKVQNIVVPIETKCAGVQGKVTLKNGDSILDETEFGKIPETESVPQEVNRIIPRLIIGVITLIAIGLFIFKGKYRKIISGSILLIIILMVITPATLADTYYWAAKDLLISVDLQGDQIYEIGEDAKVDITTTAPSGLCSRTNLSAPAGTWTSASYSYQLILDWFPSGIYDNSTSIPQNFGYDCETGTQTETFTYTLPQNQEMEDYSEIYLDTVNYNSTTYQLRQLPTSYTCSYAGGWNKQGTGGSCLCTKGNSWQTATTASCAPGSTVGSGNRSAGTCFSGTVVTAHSAGSCAQGGTASWLGPCSGIMKGSFGDPYAGIPNVPCTYETWSFHAGTHDVIGSVKSGTWSSGISFSTFSNYISCYSQQTTACNPGVITTTLLGTTNQIENSVSPGAPNILNDNYVICSNIDSAGESIAPFGTRYLCNYNTASSSCIKVVNTGTEDHFISTSSVAERNSLLANTPAGIELYDCSDPDNIVLI